MAMPTSLTTAIRAGLLLFTSVTLSGSAVAATYWVSPTGAATWASCASATPLAGTAACTLRTANANIAAGDTVYLRGGVYVAPSGYGIWPTNTGTSENAKIIYARYASETPIITGIRPSGDYGFWLPRKAYIKIDGITFRDIGTYGTILRASHHIEITNSTFTATAGNEAGSGIKIDGTYSCDSAPCWITHVWIHHNTISSRKPNDPCAEMVDLMAIGSSNGSYSVEEDNYNTIEDNQLSYAGHTILDNFGRFNVIRNNISHNEPWFAGCTNYQGGTSSDSLTLSTGTKNLTTQAGLGLTARWPVGLIYSDDMSKAMAGTLTSYNSSTGSAVVTISSAAKIVGSGTYANWIISQENVPFYENSAYNGKFGHRNFQLSDFYSRDSTHVLVEGNRLGFASNNPGNGGPMNLDAAAPGNLIRYNYIFGGMSSGIYFKYATSDYVPCPGGGHNGAGACGGTANRVYNNTIYHNGYGYNWRAYGNQNGSYSGQGIAQWNQKNTGSTGNVIKNNIIYDNKEGDICSQNLYSTPCSPREWDILTPDPRVGNWVTANGDPMFTNPDLSDATSTTLPNLTLQPFSGAIDAGTNLTQAVGAGSTSSALVVQDAMYFQDGTWGSDLARGVTFFPDWVAIGTVSNVVQISAVNYATNTITLAAPMTWSDGAKIWLYKKSDGAVVLSGAGPDLGASEFIPGTRPLPPTNLNSTVH
jgi:hypothetical protein